MKNISFALRQSIFVMVCATVFIIPLMSTPSSAAQMFPPKDSAGNICAGILEWDGHNSMTCVPGLSGDASTGNVTETYGTIMNQGMAVYGNSASFGDGKSNIWWQGICNGAGNVGSDMSGNLHCCPPGMVVTGANQSSVSCGYLN